MDNETPASAGSELESEVKEEGEEESSIKSSKKRKERKDEANEREKQIHLLQIYLDSMTYKMPETQPKASPHIERLAKPTHFRYVALHEDYGHVLIPKEREKRIEKKVEDSRVITTEQLQAHLKQQEQREDIKKEAKKKRERIFNTILIKLEKQCREQVIKEIVDKFALYMSNKCANYTPPPVMTESAQRLTRGLVCNIYLSLGVNQCPCNVDQYLYETIGLVLSDMILETLFETQHYRQNMSQSQLPQSEVLPKEKCIKQRAKRVGKKHTKKGKTRQKRSKPKKQPTLPKEFRDYMRLSNKKCTECKPTDDI